LHDLLRLEDLGLGLFQRRLNVAGIHAGKDLAGFDHGALVRKHLGNAAGILRIDVYLIGFHPAVAHAMLGGNCVWCCFHQ
jgi:hypothetical protein